MEIRDRSSDPQQPVESACRQAEAVDRMPEETLPLGSWRDRPAEGPVRQGRVAGRPAPPAGAADLAVPRGRYPEPDCSRRLSRRARSLVERQGGDGYVKVDAVEQGAGKPTQVGTDLPRRAGAGPGEGPPAAAGAGVHRGHQLEAGGHAEGPPVAGDGHGALFERLAQHLEGRPAELRQLVEEEDAVVGEAHLAGAGPRAAADEGHLARRVVRAPEGPAR